MAKNYSNNNYMLLGGRQWRVNAGGNLFVDRKFMRKAFDELNEMHQTYSQINVIFFNLHLPDSKSCKNNEIISRFMGRVRRLLRSAPYNLTRFAYIWAREQEKSEAPHYHMALIVDETRIHYPAKILDTLAQIWRSVSSGGNLYVPERCYHIVDRGDLSKLGEVIYRLSYLTKLRGKGKRLSSTNDYSTSRLAGRRS